MDKIREQALIHVIEIFEEILKSPSSSNRMKELARKGIQETRKALQKKPSIN